VVITAGLRGTVDRKRFNKLPSKIHRVDEDAYSGGVNTMTYDGRADTLFFLRISEAAGERIAQ